MLTMVGTHAPPRAASALRSVSVKNGPCSIESTPAATASDAECAIEWIATLAPASWAALTASARTSLGQLLTGP